MPTGGPRNDAYGCMDALMIVPPPLIEIPVMKLEEGDFISVRSWHRLLRRQAYVLLSLRSVSGAAMSFSVVAGLSCGQVILVEV